MTLDTVLDLVAAALLVLGGVLSLAAGVGLVRFPDALSRLHAGAKPQVLGLVLVIIAVALGSRQWATLLTLLPVLVFQLLMTPIAAHMIGRAGYRTGNFQQDLLIADELEDDIERASSAEELTPHQQGMLDDGALGDDRQHEHPRE